MQDKATPIRVTIEISFTFKFMFTQTYSKLSAIATVLSKLATSFILPEVNLY
jgi:hypothetical protein